MAVQNGKRVYLQEVVLITTLSLYKANKFVYYRIQASLYPEKHCVSL